MLPSQQSRQNAPSNLWTGAQLVSKLELTTNLLPWSLEEIWPKSNVQCVCCQIPPLSQRPGPDLITSSILCMRSVHSCIGMLEREWKRVSLVRREKTWLPWRKIMRKWDKIRLRKEKKKKMNTEESIDNLYI